ncbi:MAG: hypothetical protein DRI44_04855, partial [Chlamydiae bacterium]
AKKEATRKKTPANTNIKIRVVPIMKYHEQQIPPEDLKKIKSGKQFNKAVPEKKSVASPETTSSTSSTSPSGDEITSDDPPLPLGPVNTQDSFLAVPDGPDTYGYMHIPPDTMGVAGKDHLMTVLNSYVRIQDKSGTIISTVVLNDFWASVNGGGGGNAGTFDPKIIYDQEEDRFIFVALDDRDANSGILLGVTETSDPTGNWFLWKIDADPANNDWADFPSPGFNTNWIALSMNMFAISDNSFSESKIWMINKHRAYTNDLNVITVISSSDFTVAPCITFGNQTNIYTVVSGYYSGSDDYVRYGAINGPVNSPTWTHIGYSNVPDSDVPDDAPQLGGADLIDNGDSRIGSPPVYRFGHIFYCYTGQLSFPTRNAIIWGEFIASNGNPINAGIVQESTTPMYYAYPSIAVNCNTSIVLGFSGFSTGIYASAYYTGREFTNAANVMQGVRLLKTGEDYYYKTFGGADNRWGDYSATCVDPANDLKFWTIQEYARQDVGTGANDDRWGTWWGEIYFVPEPFLFINYYLLFIIYYCRKNF